MVSVLESPHSNHTIRIEARRAAVSLRKLLLEKLITRVIHKPRFHNLTKPKELRRLIIDANLKISYRETHESATLWTTNIKCGFAIYSLPGWTPKGPGSYDVTSDIFDASEAPRRTLSGWGNQSLLIIKAAGKIHQFSLEQIMRYVANKEGAHVANDPNDQANLLKVLGNEDTLIYPHWLMICIGIYLCNQLRSGIITHPTQWEDYIKSGVIIKPTDYIDLTGDLANLPWTPPDNLIVANAISDEYPPPKEQDKQWSIMSAV